MAYADLRAFITRLDVAGELIRIQAPVSPQWEITAITDRISRGPADQNKALLFEQVEGSTLPILTNAFGSDRRMALALGVETLDDLNHRLRKLVDPRLPGGLPATLKRGGDFWQALRSLGMGTRRVRRAPCQEVVITDQPSLDMFPLLTGWPDDAGPTIALSQVITHDPITGTRNVGRYRLQQHDACTLGIYWQRHSGGAEHQRNARDLGQDRLPVAVVLGGDPAQMWSSSAPLPPGIDEYLLAGWLRGKPVQFVNCVTQDLAVPADAEIVIEGYIDPNETRCMGPLGDHTGYYTPPGEFPVMHVTAITHRRGPILPAMIAGKPTQEDYWMGKATERLLLPMTQLFLGEIVDYHMPAAGVFHNLVIASIQPRFPGHAQKVMYGLWGLGLMMLSKAIIVVDADIDVHDPAAVAECVLNYVDWQRDITIVDGAVSQLDHAAIRDSYGGKIGVDATRKTEREPLRGCFDATDERLTRILGDNWNCSLDGLIIAGVDTTQRSVRDVFGHLWATCPDANLIAVDAGVDTRDLSAVAWQVLGNVDWRRDIMLNAGRVDHFPSEDAPRGQIAINALPKTEADGHPRGWPPEVVMSSEIIQQVDAHWAEYGFSP